MLLEKAIFAGFGGQGVMLMGQMLAKSVMKEGLQVSWLPSYGPEMRGGTANCHVVVSDHPIGSPVIYSSSTSVVLNLQSFDKFEPVVHKDGILLVNSSLIDKKSSRTDIKTYYIPANDIANTLGNLRVANMVMLGAYLQATHVCKMESLVAVLKTVLTGPKANLIKLNEQGIQEGMACIQN